MPDRDVSVIICAYSDERWRDLCAAIESVQTQTRQPSEVIVVIDHNPALLHRAQVEWSRLVVTGNSEQPGLSGARNSGLRLAAGDVVAFLDDDAAAAPDWIARLCEYYSEDTVAGVGGKIQPAWPGQRPQWFPDEFDWVVGCTYRGMPDDAAPVRNLIGANMSFRREVFEVAGNFTHGMGRVGALPAGCEETELCIRVQQRRPDWKLIYAPAALVTHRVSAERTRWRYFQSRCFAEGRSKALVTRLVGARDGLQSERTYSMRTLPSGVARNLWSALSGRDAGGLMRAGAIILGLMLTLAGYISVAVPGFFQWLESRQPESTPVT